MSDPIASVFDWLHDWASWLIAGISVLATAALAFWRRMVDVETHRGDILRMHTENRTTLADLGVRMRALEERDRITAIKITELNTMIPSIDRIEQTVIRLETRVNEIADRPIGRR